MTQELLDLRLSILEGRYEDALDLVDELEEMSKQAILRNIESFLMRLMVHLIKNQIEQRLTNSWTASISDSILRIQKLNLKANKTSYYVNIDEWFPWLEEAVEAAIAPASVEVFGGRLNAIQLSQQVERKSVITATQSLLELTYHYSGKELPAIIIARLVELPGGQEWHRD
ncbi:hypothetical protein XM38_035840 [Halomicronema hongdechloris C2206]|uniref:DUF29 domain-containing protein n=1 Tax=Halomicronema hongdechloris C2206 TaxID=1641165 RepID=A0A1Z3HQU4_9CYAN|nr:DUF29 family protein [Halomicronema hongdechloris]ASC72626.1 hypothetical protein XM38_035840 [Halomicronema hongdechloris C2206]